MRLVFLNRQVAMSPALAELPPTEEPRQAKRFANSTPERGAGPTTHEPTAEYTAFGNVEARNDLQARIEIPLLLRALALPRGVRVLEVGCGRGIALPVLAERLAPASLTGVDIDETLLEEAARRIRGANVGARLVHADVRALPLESRSVDLVIDFGTCYHVSGGTAGSVSALSEIARVLVPGGMFVHETPVAQHLAHPVRSFGKTLPWTEIPELVRDRAAVLWAVRRRSAVR